MSFLELCSFLFKQYPFTHTPSKETSNRLKHKNHISNQKKKASQEVNIYKLISKRKKEVNKKIFIFILRKDSPKHFKDIILNKNPKQFMMFVHSNNYNYKRIWINNKWTICKNNLTCDDQRWNQTFGEVLEKFREDEFLFCFVSR